MHSKETAHDGEVHSYGASFFSVGTSHRGAHFVGGRAGGSVAAGAAAPVSLEACLVIVAGTERCRMDSGQSCLLSSSRLQSVLHLAMASTRLTAGRGGGREGSGWRRVRQAAPCISNAQAAAGVAGWPTCHRHSGWSLQPEQRRTGHQTQGGCTQQHTASKQHSGHAPLPFPPTRLPLDSLCCTRSHTRME